IFLILINLLFRYEIIDPTNKAFGLNYSNRNERPAYDRESLLALCTEEKVQRDITAMTRILDAWKAKQGSDKPVMFLIATSGGGTRSASFTLNTLQHLDSISGGKLMSQTFLITGASGGMLGASYFRELSRLRDHNKSIHLQDKKYLENISGDLLNPMLSSFVARDLASPSQKFKAGDFYYIKDRGYAFEQKLSENTGGVLDKQLKDLAPEERSARIPLMMFNAVITRDSRRMIISTQPISFLMRPQYDSTRISTIDPDAVDFAAMFNKQSPMNLRLLTALRMNATFPYVLPNVWLPSIPVVDVMDAGLRDNFGQETALRFLFVFRKWIAENTGKVVLIQIRDRKNGGWEHPFESDNIMDMISKPMLLLQYNYYKIQEYNQNETISMEGYMESGFNKISFEYVPRKEEAGAALNFHLTKSEKKDIAGALKNENNSKSFKIFKRFMR
ncbi:MAG: patatin-like phospholipase family protein, partial [Chitinophagaceae bacterium]